MDHSSIGFATAFLAGAVSFLSPCVLPLVPAYVSYIAGRGDDDPSRRRRLAALLLSAWFVLGFGAVFVALGASATTIGHLLLRYRSEANVVGGSLIIVFGLIMLGALRRLTWLQRDFRLPPRLAGGHPLAAFVLGVAFGFGWTPCIGPILGAILTLAAVQTSTQESMALLATYALGLGVPFLLAAAFTGELIARLKTLRRAGQQLHTVAGIVMVLFGLAMVTGKLTAISYWCWRCFLRWGASVDDARRRKLLHLLRRFI